LRIGIVLRVADLNRSAKKMKSFSPSAKIGFAGGIGGVLAFAILFLGLGAIGGGHGSPAIWYVGLAVAALSSVLLLASVVRTSIKRTERKSLIAGIAAVAVFSVVWLKFFTIVDWLPRRI
jgi:hypothetical protein